MNGETTASEVGGENRIIGAKLGVFNKRPNSSRRLELKTIYWYSQAGG